jgi:hypothetical protein
LVLEADEKGHQDHPKKEKWNYVQALVKELGWNKSDRLSRF